MQQTELLPDQFKGKVKFKEKQVQGNHYFETDADVEKAGWDFQQALHFLPKKFSPPSQFLKGRREIGGFCRWKAFLKL